MSGLVRLLPVATVLVLWTGAVLVAHADEAVGFRATPEEYEWRALRDYNRQPDAFDGVFPYWPYNPIEYNDVYRLPDGLVLDVDGDGIGEHLLMIDHPAACDTEGCDVLVLEGEVRADAPTDFRLDGVLHLPVAALGSARILLMEEDFVFLEGARHLLLHATIDGARVQKVVEERYGAVDFNRLDTRDMGFASIDPNGDRRPEVFSAIAVYTYCGTRGNCGGGIITPLSEDTEGPYPWRWRDITPSTRPSGRR